MIETIAQCSQVDWAEIVNTISGYFVMVVAIAALYFSIN